MARVVLLALMAVASVLAAETEIVVEKAGEAGCVGAKPGDTVWVDYTGTLEDGRVFDTSRQENREPISFQLGQGKVIPGWEQGLMGACEGEMRKLKIPPELAYGDTGVKDVIPPKAHLFFDVEVKKIEQAPAKPSRGGKMSLVTALLVLAGFTTIMVFLLKHLNQKKDATRKKSSGKRK
eukprot:m.125246 g.125246  ORF g.125246 m.125246 type:complete len:179 (+) comp19772_c3_seq1:33-569(+)